MPNTDPAVTNPTVTDPAEVDLYVIKFPDGTLYTDHRTGTSAWAYRAAVSIAKRIARKYAKSITVSPLKFEVTTEVIDQESAYDRVVNYAHSLKGHSLTEALRNHNLPVGRDAAASKRERLIAHLLRSN